MLPPPPGTRTVGTAQLGTPVTVGSTSMPARVARSIAASGPLQSIAPLRCGLQGAPVQGDPDAGHAAVAEPLQLFAAEGRLRHRAPELRRQRLGAARRTAMTPAQATTSASSARNPSDFASPLSPSDQLAFGETCPPEPPRCRRCLMTTAPIEIAARAAIAIRIGISGEEEPSSAVVAAAVFGVETAFACQDQPRNRGLQQSRCPPWSRCLGYSGPCRHRCPCRPTHPQSRPPAPAAFSPVADCVRRPLASELPSSRVVRSLVMFRRGLRSGSSSVRVRRPFRPEPKPESKRMPETSTERSANAERAGTPAAVGRRLHGGQD